MIKHYRESLIESKDLAQLRLTVYPEGSLSYALLNLQIKWLQLVINILGGEDK